MKTRRFEIIIAKSEIIKIAYRGLGNIYKGKVCGAISIHVLFCRDYKCFDCPIKINGCVNKSLGLRSFINLKCLR